MRHEVLIFADGKLKKAGFSTKLFSTLVNCGSGLFETILLLDGRPVFLTEHLKRLYESAGFSEICLPEPEEFYNKLLEFSYGLKQDKAALKVSAYFPASEETLIYCQFKEYSYPDELLKTGVSLCISELRRHSANPVYVHKHIFRAENDLVQREAKTRGRFDAIVLNEKGFITETSKANIFLIKQGHIFTPPISHGLLPGVVKNVIIENFNVREKSIKVEEIFDADEVFLTNSLVGVLPVLQIEDKSYHSCMTVSQIQPRVWKLFRKSLFQKAHD